MSRTGAKEVDVCIIGSGVAGTVLASELVRRGLDVLVVDAGPRHDVSRRHDYMRQRLLGTDPWASNVPDRDQFTWDGLKYPLNAFRVKGIGGSGLHWGGMVDRLHESDLELRSRYGFGVDWPIRYGDLEPDYVRAEHLMGVAGADAPPWTPWRSRPYPMPPFPPSHSDRLLKPAFDRLGIPLYPGAVARNSQPYDGRSRCLSFAMCDTCPTLAKWTPDVLLGRLEAAGKVAVAADTRVVRLNTSGGTLESVAAVSSSRGTRRTLEYRAQRFVLAAHAVESARLLLLSRSPAAPRGLGNAGGCVGRYFSDHLGLLVTAELREKTYPERIGFATSTSHYFYESARAAGHTAFVLSPQNRYVRPPLEIVNEEVQENLVWGEALGRRVRAKFGSTAGIVALIECLPYEDNTVSLDPGQTDDLGLPVPRIRYAPVRDREAHTVQAATEVIRRLFETLGATSIRVAKPAQPTAHMMGTCRMGDDPGSAVVDRDLKVHGVDNLYAVGSSVFPTFGAAHPTLTIAALALRLGTHLADTPGPSRRT